MSPERWQQIEEIYQTLIERDPDDRSEFLTQFCAGDNELRQEVESLLAQGQYDTFIQDPIKDAALSLSLSAAVDHDRIETQLGPYRITSLIGVGGMGAVYAASRNDDLFTQQVAIKIVKRGMDTHFVLRRFRAERRILAGLDHPQIARLIDGGTTPDGLPYFVMEFVAGGRPINEYCDEQKLSLVDRIQLFRQVCGAVQYAHQKLVVHRDLKPSNILINTDGQPKLLDFGIAKLLDTSQSGEAITKTETALRAMTPDYASPEQVRGLPVTTTTDVYSLGAVLYELLTGQRPHRLETYTPTEIDRVVCEIDVERPSEAAARTNRLSAKSRRRLAGDLDNIVMMALRKEPGRRYQSVEQFSEDLRRCLEGHPVLARGDTMAYRAGKFIRRHKVGVTSTALIMLSLLIGLVIANQQTRRAEQRFQQVRKLANTFLFDFHDQIRNLPGSTASRELMVKTALEYLDNLAREAQDDADLQLELAQAYLEIGDVQGDPWAPNLGHSDAAMKSYQNAVSLAESLVSDDGATGPELRVLATAFGKLGMLKAEVGDKQSAQEYLLRGERLAMQAAQLTGAQQDIAFAETFYGRLGEMQLDTGDVQGALRSFSHSLEWSKRQAEQSPNDETRVALAVNFGRIGEALGAAGSLPEAIENYRQAAAIHEDLRRKDPGNTRYRRGLRASYSWLGSLHGNPNYVNLGDLKGAIEYSRRALALAAELSALDDKNVLAQSDLASTYARLGDVLVDSDPNQALSQYRQAVAVTERLLARAPNEFRVKLRHAICLTKMGNQLSRMGDSREAIPKLLEAGKELQSLAARDVTNVPLQTDLQQNRLALADAVLRLGDRGEALKYFEQAVAAAEKATAASPQDLNVLLRLIYSSEGMARYYEAAVAKPQTDERESCLWRRKAMELWTDWNRRAPASKFGEARLKAAQRALCAKSNTEKRQD